MFDNAAQPCPVRHPVHRHPPIWAIACPDAPALRCAVMQARVFDGRTASALPTTVMNTFKS